jgi:ubiquinone/menaquinone biosynthesis C-methylase UbiE
MSTAIPYQPVEEKAGEAFDKQSIVFDELFSANQIVQYKRERVRSHIISIINPSSSILELNAGTGDDAIYFASLGHSIHTTDLSVGMQKIRCQKIQASGFEDKISDECCSFTQLENLKQQGPYDHIFSNFGGLNCTNDLAKVLDSFEGLLKRKGTITLVIMPKFSIWEFGLLFKGKWKTAFRRFSGKKGTPAHIEGVHFTCWYYNPSFVLRHLRKNYELLELETLCHFVPPSFMENFPVKYSQIYSKLKSIERRWGKSWPWNRMGDYFIISLRKRD